MPRASRCLLPHLVILQPKLAIYSAPSAPSPTLQIFSPFNDSLFSLRQFSLWILRKIITSGRWGEEAADACAAALSRPAPADWNPHWNPHWNPRLESATDHFTIFALVSFHSANSLCPGTSRECDHKTPSCRRVRYGGCSRCRRRTHRWRKRG